MRRWIDIRRCSRMCGLGSALLAVSACGVLPGGRGDAPARPASRAAVLSVDPSPSARACFGELQAQRIGFSPVPNQRFSGGCSQIDAIRLTDVGAEVTNLGPVKCELARNFAAWTEYAVKRAARQFLDADLARIETFGSYSCRTIAGSSKLSEHAHANAIDIAAFVLADGRRISVEDGWRGNRDEREFLAAIHKSACRRFGTVLSPDYNAAHRDHFHLDMGGKGYCR